jgi:hypothetical protein
MPAGYLAGLFMFIVVAKAGLFRFIPQEVDTPRGE